MGDYRDRLTVGVALGGVLTAGLVYGQAPVVERRVFDLATMTTLALVNTVAQTSDYKGRRALRLSEAARLPDDGEGLAIIPDLLFQDGSIELELAGFPREDAAATARGFVGLAFRVRTDPITYECFYLRPTNGRAEEQLRRNRSTQYVSHPDFPWHRLRKESPGVYESYVDLLPGAWTQVRIQVTGARAKLYVHDAEQPSLIVKDLKRGHSAGSIALWIGPGTEAYFGSMVVAP